MAELTVMQPKSLYRPKSWSAEVENAYRFQLAGYRDEMEYKSVRKTDVIIISQLNLRFHKSYFIILIRLLNDGPRLDLLKSCRERRTAISIITTKLVK